jgi:hypothetical protein
MDSVDDVGDECDAVFLCLADDRSTLDVATPNDHRERAGSRPW